MKMNMKLAAFALLGLIAAGATQAQANDNVDRSDTGNYSEPRTSTGTASEAPSGRSSNSYKKSAEPSYGTDMSTSTATDKSRKKKSKAVESEMDDQR